VGDICDGLGTCISAACDSDATAGQTADGDQLCSSLALADLNEDGILDFSDAWMLGKSLTGQAALEENAGLSCGSCFSSTYTNAYALGFVQVADIGPEAIAELPNVSLYESVCNQDDSAINAGDLNGDGNSSLADLMTMIYLMLDQAIGASEITSLCDLCHRVAAQAGYNHGIGDGCAVDASAPECYSDSACTPELCPDGEIPDCAGNCAPVDWATDGYCDDGAYDHPEDSGTYIYFNCDAFDNDAGQCDSPGNDGECADGYTKDCHGYCGVTQWVGNGICNNSGVGDFDCSMFNYDGSDCL